MENKEKNQQQGNDFNIETQERKYYEDEVRQIVVQSINYSENANTLLGVFTVIYIILFGMIPILLSMPFLAYSAFGIVILIATLAPIIISIMFFAQYNSYKSQKKIWPEKKYDANDPKFKSDFLNQYVEEVYYPSKRLSRNKTLMVFIFVANPIYSFILFVELFARDHLPIEIITIGYFGIILAIYWLFTLNMNYENDFTYKYLNHLLDHCIPYSNTHEVSINDKDNLRNDLEN